jgi:hypothetical protein
MLPLIALLITGCGIKKEVKESATKIEQSILSVEKNIPNEKLNFNNSSIAKDFQVYIIKENLLANFDNSEKLLSSAKDKLKSIKDLIEKDKSNDNQKVLVYISDIRNILSKIEKSNNYPMERLVLLKKSFQEAPQLFENISKIEKNIDSKVNINLSLLNESKKSFPMKQQDIDSKILNLENHIKSLKSNVNLAKLELDKDINMDISNFVNASDKVKEIEKNIISLISVNEKLITELNKSYMKILADMKEEHYIVIGRVSWDEYYDYPTEHNYSYTPKLIPTDMLDNFENINDNIASYSKGMFGSLNVKIDKTIWNKLNINHEEKWPSGDDQAEYWIEDIVSNYYHKYIIIENDKKTETDFIKVDENTFYSNIDNLGMSILSKPYGYYESETDRQPTPPGLAFVDNPKYGEWKTDSSGNSFFHYYGMYSMFNDLTGNNRYSRDYYNDYNRDYRNKKPYYSGGYGTNGERTKSTRFGKSNYSSVNKSKSTYSNKSVKNTGSVSRGRGPGGGGK